MGIVRLTLFTFAGLSAALWWYGRDEGLPEDRLGRDPAEVAALTALPPPPTARPTTPPKPQLSIALAPAKAPAVSPALAPAEEAETRLTAVQTVATPSVPVTDAIENAVSLAATDQVSAPPSPPPPPHLFVTGSRVNMRAGPSTSTGVVAALVRGTVVEDLGPAGEGWSTIRVVETGARGYMASRFLSPDQP